MWRTIMYIDNFISELKKVIYKVNKIDFNKIEMSMDDFLDAFNILIGKYDQN